MARPQAERNRLKDVAASDAAIADKYALPDGMALLPGTAADAALAASIEFGPLSTASEVSSDDPALRAVEAAPLFQPHPPAAAATSGEGKKDKGSSKKRKLLKAEAKKEESRRKLADDLRSNTRRRIDPFLGFGNAPRGEDDTQQLELGLGVVIKKAGDSGGKIIGGSEKDSISATRKVEGSDETRVFEESAGLTDGSSPSGPPSNGGLKALVDYSDSDDE